MLYRKTIDYDKFSCIADKCPASCCTGWQISIDNDSLLKYSQFDGGFGNFIKNSIDWEQGCFLQYDNRCALLNDENLCELQLEKGEGALCYTCSQHPRHVEDFEGTIEYSLDLSCPEVARIYCEELSKVEIISYEDDVVPEKYDSFNHRLFSQLITAREDLFSIVGNREKTLVDRMEEVILYADRIQQIYDTGNGEGISQSPSAEFSGKEVANFRFDDESHFSRLYELEHLDDGFTDLLDECRAYWFETGSSVSPASLSELTEEESRAGENILKLLIYIYFCGAVYDGMISSKVRIAVYTVRWILMMNRAVGYRYHGLAGITYRLCREIEHAEDNLEKLDDHYFE